MNPRALLRPRAIPSGARLAMLAAAVALTAAGLAKPMVPLPADVFRHLVVFDITQSMNVPDAVPGDHGLTRLGHAKAVVLEAATALPCGSELGLGLFTGHRTFLLLAPVEVCASYPDLAAAVRAVDWRMAWTARSEVAKGVHSGLRIARALGPQTALVFLTDGHEAPPLHPELRPSYGGEPGTVRGLLAGIGGPVPQPIPKLDPQGGDLGYWGAEDVMQVDELSLGRGTSVSEGYAGVGTGSARAGMASGTEHLSALHEAHLRSLANGLQLRYRRVETASDLRSALLHPDFANERESATDLRPVLAGAAALLAAASYVAPARRRRAPRDGGAAGTAEGSSRLLRTANGGPVDSR